MTPATLRAVVSARAEGRPVAIATRLADGAQWVLPSADTPAEIAAAAQALFATERSATVPVGGQDWFIQTFSPPARVVIVGAVHVAQSLAPLCVALGFGVAVVDPRGAFATSARFPDVALSSEWPDEALAGLAPDGRTAVVALTHDPKLDDPALDAALRTEAFYIGALGSRRTHGGRLERLRALGHDDAALARVRGPVGLAIGAVTAPEIALSILAQIVAVRRGGKLAT